MISAIVLAAGKSVRMGQPKMLLPWGKSTVLGAVVQTLGAAGVTHILVVAGAARKSVEAVARKEGASTVFNPAYADGEMLSSIQAGIRELPSPVEAALIALGDQPRMQPQTVTSVVEAYAEYGAQLVVPSYNMRRGHPWLIDRRLWPELLDLKRNESSRDFLHLHADYIRYVQVDSPTILEDMDTPRDYLKLRP
jgi:molybdenum cofactor cytidylyltransferase